MPDSSPRSWGLLPPAEHTLHLLRRRDHRLPRVEGSALPHGLGRSYGDSCLNDGGALLLTRGLDRWIAFDRETGLLECEAGVSLSEILDLVVPAGWFLPVIPGTRHVTLGGAIANDVHGKNHHRAGTFARHVRSFELLRSDGLRRVCSREQNAKWFRATVGGLGLTGLITRATVQLRPIVSSRISVEELRMGGLDDFFALADESDASHEYTVAWIDALARGPDLGRGVFIRGDHSDTPGPLDSGSNRSLAVPFHAPSSLLNRHTVRAFNALYRRRFRGDQRRFTSHFTPFFHPLDRIDHWNRLYGRRGFFQHQCVLPEAGNPGAVRDLLSRVARSGQASFLAVLKRFGAYSPEGLLSFPRPGVTLALDFPDRGPVTRELLDDLDDIVVQNGGALYPAKDARMSAEHFRQFFPALDLFIPYLDPAFGSGFWRRVRPDL